MTGALSPSTASLLRSIQHGLLLCVLVGLAGLGCASSRTYVATEYTERPEAPPAGDLLFRLFLVGNVGDRPDGAAPEAFPLLQRHLHQAGAQSAVLFLGDHLGRWGLPDSSDARRLQAETHLLALRDVLDGYPGAVYVLPGDRDWAPPSGVETVRRAEAFLETMLGRGPVVLPDDGFPGPVALELADELTLIVLGTPWWLAQDDKPFGDTGPYTLHEAGDFLDELDQLLVEHRNDHVVIAGHHPMYSNGPYGGHFPFRDHSRPVPLVGTLRVAYRGLVGTTQDLASAPYRALRQALTTRFELYDGLIYAGAHDRSLQYFRVGSARVAQHYLVAGSAPRAGSVVPGHGASFASGQPGFLSLQVFADRSIWLDAWAVTPDAPAGTLLFRTRLKDPAPAPLPPDELVSVPAPNPAYVDSTVTQAANPAYQHNSAFRRFLLGSHWRSVWAVPVEAPVFDLGRVDGGLRPVKLGGRGQSTSIRFAAPSGREYVLRSIDKEAGRAWPEALRATFARDLTQDQFAMLHPYAAFILPPLAEAAGIYHTNPRLVYVPDDPRLGRYRAQLAGTLALFEERPDDDMSDVASMGHADDVISSWDMLQETTGDNDHRVDARFYARTRLFDMLISDWDRHEDQWRWAAFEPVDLNPTLKGEARTQGKIYRPIPRDRDVALMRMNGLLPSIAKRTAMPMYQDFSEHYGYVKGLNQNGLALDRRFTAGLTRSDWITLADSIRLALTDDRIETAVRQLPGPVYDLTGETITRTFKARRDQLPAVAETYYETLARIVDVVGSHKHERFEVHRLDDRATEVVMLKTTKEGEVRRELFRRVFFHDETREVRLYGLGGNDTFEVTGDVSTSLRIIAVGGTGSDRFIDASRVRGRRRMTHFYDSPEGDTWATSDETRVIRSRDPRMNAYDLHAYRYNRTLPVAFFGFNKDDGVFVGGGATYTRHGFRREPFAQSHTIKANVAAATRAFNLHYQGQITDVIRTLDVSLDVLVNSPNQIRNFYGLGNTTTTDDRDARFYQARLSQVRIMPQLRYSLADGIDLSFGPHLTFTNVREDTSRFIAQPQAGISASTFDHQWHAGVQGALELKALDSPVAPLQGYRWTSSATVNLGLQSRTDSYSTLTSALSVYVPISYTPQVTLAARVGGAHTVGSFPFFAATTLGGAENLRGVRSTRYAGRSSFYQNLELRWKLATFTSYLAFGDVGLLGFVDNGRVWADGDDTNLAVSQSFFEGYHQGYGGGLWLQLYGRSVLTVTSGFSKDDRTLTVQFGFLY